MTARDELVRAIGEAILAEARKWPQLPGDRYGARTAPMGATVDDLGRAALAVVDEELAVLRAKLALSPVQVDAMVQEMAELKQEHGVLSGQLHEIRAIAGEWRNGGVTGPDAMRRVCAIVDAEQLPDSEPDDGPWEWGCGVSLDEVFGMDEETARQYAEQTGTLRKRRPAGPWIEVPR
jgi:hypothetical protein